jgi:adenylylsulfate reductase subunit B
LGADIGGNGALLYVKESAEIMEWILKRPDGTTERISVDRAESNSY